MLVLSGNALTLSVVKAFVLIFFGAEQQHSNAMISRVEDPKDDTSQTALLNSSTTLKFSQPVAMISNKIPTYFQ